MKQPARWITKASGSSSRTCGRSPRIVPSLLSPTDCRPCDTPIASSPSIMAVSSRTALTSNWSARAVATQGSSAPRQVYMKSAKVIELFAHKRQMHSAQELAFLPAALEIVETPPSPAGRAIGATIILIACVALAWASLGEIDIVSSAQGRIVPSDRVKLIQPMEIGVVRTLLVEDGQKVKAGDVLVEIDPTINEAEARQARHDLKITQLDIAR